MTTRTELNEDKQLEIQKEQQRQKRKKLILLFLKIIIAITLIMTILFLYINNISTKKIIVKEKRIINNKITNNFNGLKIIQISDIHYGTTFFIDEIKNLVKLINLRKPDLVVFTGDLIDKNYKINSKEQEALITELKRIKTTIGKYSISGEEDGENYPTIMNQADFTILNNEYDLIYKDNNEPLLLIGLSSSTKKEIDINKAYSYFKEESHNSNIYTIAILHEPDSVDEILSNYQTDLFLAGHSHNGQIRLPIIGSITKKENAKKYDQEFYQLDSSQLYISSGIGTNGNGIRFFTRPSINFFRLSNN